MKVGKCAVVGCGFVGSAVAYTLLQQQLFSEIVLLDVDFDRAEGEALDMVQGAPFLSPMSVYAGDYPDTADCSLIIIAAGAGQRAGETRMDLLARNAAIIQGIVSKICRYNNDAMLLIISNPVDVLTYVAGRVSGWPSRRVIGSGTVLDTARLKQLVGQHFGVDPRNVHSFILGEHGDSEFPVWSSANISGIDLSAFCALRGLGNQRPVLDELFEQVRTSAYRIIEKKGATCYAIAQATARIVRCILHDEKSILPVSALADGHYGQSDVCFGVPAVVGRQGVEQILDIPLNSSERDRLEKSVSVLKESLRQLAIGV